MSDHLIASLRIDPELRPKGWEEDETEDELEESQQSAVYDEELEDDFEEELDDDDPGAA